MMFSAMRKRPRFSPATVIAGLALVFAMTGGAYAAKKYLITSTKQISPSVLKQLQGKAGPAGAAGAQGAQGPAGPAGSAGAGGAKGETGPAGGKGEKGSAGATGAKGATGATGFTEVLPKGKTETGSYAYNNSQTDPAHVPISFVIPLAAPLGSKEVHLLNAGGTEEYIYNEEKEKVEEVTPVRCGTALTPTGTVKSPAAAPGNLCVYVEKNLPGISSGDASASNFIMDPSNECEGLGCTIDFGGSGPGAGTTGARIEVEGIEGSGGSHGWGDWAVTAP